MANSADLRRDTSSSVTVEGVENVKLTAMQQLFAEAYLAGSCRNGAEAMRQAGYRGNNPYVAASAMLKKPNVSKYIQMRKRHMLKEAGVQSINILLELAAIAFADIRELYNEDGTLKNIKLLPKGIAASLEAVETDEIFGEDGEVIGVTKKVKMNSKLKALELLMRFKGLLNKDKTENPINLNNFNVSLDLGGNTPKTIVNE